ATANGPGHRPPSPRRSDRRTCLAQTHTTAGVIVTARGFPDASGTALPGPSRQPPVQHQIAERHKCPAPAGSCRRNAAPREVAMNSVGTHPPPAAPARDENQIMITETGRERHDQVANLVTRARNGDQRAWDALVERYAPLIWSICRRYQLGRADAEDVGQYVWLNLVSQLGNLRDPAALPGWLATTTARECAKALRAARRPPAWQMPDDGSIPDTLAATAEQELLLAERHATLREALTCLPPGCQ